MKKIITLFMLVMLTITVSAQKATFRHHPNQLLTGKTFMKATPKARMKANLKKKLTIKSAQPKNAATVINVNAAEIVDYGTVAEGLNEYLLAMYDSNDGYPDLEIYMYANPDDITGQYSVESGTIDNSNSYVLLSEEDFDMFETMYFSIEKVAEGYKVTGSATGFYNDYTFTYQGSIEVGSAYNYDYEPDKVTTINYTASEYSVENYAEEYGVTYFFLNNNDYSLCLEYVSSTLKGNSLPAGTYNIDFSGEEETFSASVGGDDYYDYGSYIAADFEEYEGELYYNSAYYLVSGTVTVSYDEEGTMTMVVNATTAKGSTAKVTCTKKAAPAPGEGIDIVIADYKATSFTTAEGIKVAASGGNNQPAYNATSNDLRVYANGTLTIDAGDMVMTQIDFYLSAQGLKRQAEITPSTGEMSYDMDNGIVTWIGEASSVAFSVGTSATYGSENEKAGQFDFTKITVSTSDTPVDRVLQEITLSGQNTELFLNTLFEFGGKVTAHYDNGATADVTSKATFTGYDMATLGSQTVTVSYTENNITKQATYSLTVVEQPEPPIGDAIEIVIADYEATSFTTAEGIKVAASGGNNTPIYNSSSCDLRVYAKGTLTVDAGNLTMTSILFDISAQGKRRQAEITPSTGSMTYDVENGQVTWTGNANSVEFTVGTTADYGSESSKAGQFDFTKMTISTSQYTGIEDIQNRQSVSFGCSLETGRTFNLQGVSVNGNWKGIVIVNGKKYLVK